MAHTIPEKTLIAMPESPGSSSKSFKIVPPEQALVSVFDRSFHFGDSLYEVTRSYDGILFSMDEHLHRLKTSAQLAMFEVMPDLDHIKQMTTEACRAFFRKFGNIDIYVRITVSRGVGDLNIDRAAASEPYAVVIVKALEKYPAKHYTDGMHYAVVDRRRNLPQALDPAMKSGNYLNNILALVEAKKMGASDAVLLNYQGFVTEGTTNNVHCVKNGEVWTSPLSVGILAGITRDWLFQLCTQEKIPIQERLYTEAELASADEMFLSSATKEIMPITRLTGQPVGNGKPGPVTLKLHRAMKALIQDYCVKRKSESLYI